MKYAIMSDIHGNLEAFRLAVIDATKRDAGVSPVPMETMPMISSVVRNKCKLWNLISNRYLLLSAEQIILAAFSFFASIGQQQIRRMKMMKKLAMATLVAGGVCTADAANVSLPLTQEWDKTFSKSGKVEHSKVTFKNRFGIMLAADVYKPVGSRVPRDTIPPSRFPARSAR